MKRNSIILLLLFLVINVFAIEITFTGDFKSSCGHLLDEKKVIGNLNIKNFTDFLIKKDSKSCIDFQLALDSNINYHSNYSSNSSNFDLKFYRLWGRYFQDSFEIRIGLQQINFGSANYLRVLNWFDNINPLDPQKNTNGTAAILLKYYFLNNSSIWIWNENTVLGKAIMTVNFKNDKPDFLKLSSGIRYIQQIETGEIALNYNYKQISKLHQIGFDGKINLGLGLWFEDFIEIKDSDSQHLLDFGLDYTFAISNGIYASLETLSLFEPKNSLKQKKQISVLNFMYPLNLFDNISYVLTYSSDAQKISKFVSFSRKYDNMSFYINFYQNLIYRNLDKIEFIENSLIELSLIYNF